MEAIESVSRAGERRRRAECELAHRTLEISNYWSVGHGGL